MALYVSSDVTSFTNTAGTRGYEYEYRGAGRGMTISPQSTAQVRNLVRAMQGADSIANREWRAAMAAAASLGEEHGRELAPAKSGALKASIFSRVEEVGSQILGHVGSHITSIYPFIQERGRKPYHAPYGFIGRFYLYYGVKERRADMLALFDQANQKIVAEIAAAGNQKT